jgi:fatty acid desaturase
MQTVSNPKHTAVRDATTKELTRAQIIAIIELHKLSPLQNCIKIPALYGLATAVGWVIIEYPYWQVRLFAYPAMACVFAGVGVLLHDGAHGILFKNKLHNRCVSQVLAGSLGIGFTQFRYSHIFHHKYTLNDQDRDGLFYLRNIPYSILNGGYALYTSTMAGLKTAGVRSIITYVIEMASIVFVAGCLVAFFIHNGWLMNFVHVYVIPYLLFPLILIARLLLEHYECDPENDYTLSRTIKTNFICRWLWSNVNYHTVHHFWPTIPWYNLKKAHDLIEPNLIENGTPIDSGYLKLLAGAVVKYGFTKPPYWHFPKKESLVQKKRRPTLRVIDRHQQAFRHLA